jgi:hypothetical protein
MKTEKKILIGMLSFFGLLSLAGIVMFFVLTPEVAGRLLTFDGTLDESKLGIFNLAKMALLGGSLLFLSLSILGIVLRLLNKLSVVFEPLERIIVSFRDFFLGTGLQENPKRSKMFLIGILLLGTVFRLFIGDQKAYYHLDETLTVRFTNAGSGLGGGVDDENFSILTGEEIEENLSINNFERFNFQSMQRIFEKDPHPPLYYWLFHSVQASLGGGTFTPWPGIILNILFFLGTGFILFLISVRTIKDPLLRLLPVFLLAVLPLTISTSVFLRMYELLMLSAVLLLFTAHKLVYQEKTGAIEYFSLAGAVALGLLTQYYFLIFSFFVLAVSVIILLRRKGIEAAIKAVGAVFLGAAFALIVNPSMIHNLIGSPRGAEAIGGFLAFGEYFRDLKEAFFNLSDSTVFLPFFVAILLLAVIVKALLHKGRAQGIVLLSLPLILTFMTIAKVAPYTTARYYVFLIPGLLILLGVSLESIIDGKRITYALLVLMLILLPRFVSNEIFDKSVGSTFLSYNNPRSGTYQYLGDEGTEVVLLIDNESRWKSTAQMPGLVNKEKIVALTYTANKEVQRLVWEEVAQSTETYLLGLTEKSLPEGLTSYRSYYLRHR